MRREEHLVQNPGRTLKSQEWKEKPVNKTEYSEEARQGRASRRNQFHSNLCCLSATWLIPNLKSLWTQIWSCHFLNFTGSTPRLYNYLLPISPEGLFATSSSKECCFCTISQFPNTQKYKILSGELIGLHFIYSHVQWSDALFPTKMGNMIVVETTSSTSISFCLFLILDHQE